MASKKRTCHRGSSSSAPTFDATRFQSLVKQNSFTSVFSKKQVIVERQVRFEKMDIDFSLWLRERAWDSLYVFDNRAYDALVQEFYNNFFEYGDESFKTFVRGLEIEINPNIIDQFIDIDRSLNAEYPPPEPASDDMEDPAPPIDWAEVISTLTAGHLTALPGATMKQRSLTPSYRMLNLFVCFNLHPKGRYSEVITETGHLLYMIGTGRSIDVPLTIFRHMRAAPLGASFTSLPYGALITRFLLSRGVALGPHDSLVKGRGPITYRTISLSSAHVDESGDEGHAQADAEAANIDDPARPSYLQDFEDRLLDQSVQMELLEHRMDNQFQEVFSQMKQLQIGSTRVEDKLDTLLSRFPPPPQ